MRGREGGVKGSGATISLLHCVKQTSCVRKSAPFILNLLQSPELKGGILSLPAARSSSLRCLNREERLDFEPSRRSVEPDRRRRGGEVERGRGGGGEVERGVRRRSLLNTSYSSEEILAAPSAGRKRPTVLCLLGDQLSRFH